MSNPNSNNTKAPDYAKLYKQGIQTDLKFLPQQLAAELKYRNQYSPAFTQQALELQHRFDPALANEQLNALQRRDPQWLAMHQSLGDKIQQALNQGYIDPRQEAAYQQLSQSVGQGEPQREAAYNALGKQVTGDTLRGTTADPATMHQMTQAILSRSPSLSYGEAQDMAAAVYTGQRGQQLQQQRQAATGNFLQQATPLSQRQQSLSNFYGMNAPEMQVYGLAGTYIQPSNSVTSAINQIQGVTAPTALQYVNPSAPSQALAFGLNNFQNQMAAGQTGGGNPWTNALQGAAQGSQYGSIGGPYGAAGGAVVGGVAGAFGYPTYSDERLKQNLTRTGLKTKDGIELVEYDMFGRRYKGGVIAQEVWKIRPDVIGTNNGYLTVNYAKLGIETPQACDALPCHAAPYPAEPLRAAPGQSMLDTSPC